MGIGVSGQNGEPARRIGHVDTAKIHAQEVATILFLLMGGETALEVVLKLKVLFIPYSITNSFELYIVLCCCTVVLVIQILFHCDQNAGNGLIIKERKNATDALGKLEPGARLR